VTAARLYLIGVAATVGLGAVIAFSFDPGIRREIVCGLVIGLLVQAPLGWSTLRSIGTERFQLVWVTGTVIRLALVGIAALILIPALGWQMAPALGALVATVLALLLVEVVTASMQHSGIRAR
jgi:peptidoglycan biosynthesis protein MviN/MurJ (putative lipid II flippase)